MNARLASVLSLTGVLIAGSAAAVVNTQVLNSSSPAGNVQFVGASPASDTATSTSTASGTNSTLEVSAPTATQASYQIGEAGVVTLDAVGGLLTVVSAIPNDGWVLASTEREGAYDVEVRFRSAYTEVEFHANLLFGVIGTSVESRNLDLGTMTTSGSQSSSPRTGTVDDDRDDDRHEDDDDKSDDDKSDDDESDDD